MAPAVKDRARTAAVASGTAVFDALPGMETPVGDVRRALAALWEVEPTPGSPAPSEYRASQMNLVLHLGVESTPEEARSAFDTALLFSRRYPCRVIALCPQPPGSGGDVQAKIFCECYIGQSRREMVCSEAIVLTYPLEQRAFLQDQASILLESDLPVYYWPQRIAVPGRLRNYRLFLKEARRIVIDSAIERPELVAFAWPRPEVVHDLAYARLLPVRQNVGQFLSYIPAERLVAGLQSVELRHRPEFAAEGRVLLDWSRRGIEACARLARTADVKPEFVLRADPALGSSLCAEWRYQDGGALAFAYDFASGSARIDSSVSFKRGTIAASVRPLAPEVALAEALFF